MRVHFVFALFLLHVAALQAAGPPFDQLSFTDLIRSDLAYTDSSDVLSIEDGLWQKYIKTAKDDSARKLQHDRRALTYGDKTMRFSFERRGVNDGRGFPVYIALHGGGTAPPGLNDSQWEHMKIYYRDSVDNGIYVATRGVSDTWDLHFQNESYPLYDRLIENLVTYEGADPNRIYFLGFSAGGDGVYQVVPRMADRFAAANMSAGHHNWIRFDNLLNTPFLMQVGERDSAYNRSRVAAENFITMNGLAEKHGGYVHDVFIHASSGHNGWYDNDARGGNHPIISNPKAWLEGGDRGQISKNTNAVHWLKNYQRQTLPNHVIWDLTTRSPRGKTWGANYVSNADGLKSTRDLFYWLAIDDENVNEGRIEVVVSKSENAIFLKEVTGVNNFRILLHRDMMDFTRPVVVYFHNEKIAEVMPSAKLNVMARSLLERGDASLMFHDEISIHLNSLTTNAVADELFTYCTEGHCSLRTAANFKSARNFPLDVNYTCKNDNHYALTFDDGPSANFPELLEILARHNVKATFFVVGKNLESEEGKSRLRLAHEAGHQIANHTYTHSNLVELTSEQVKEQVLSTQTAILSAIGDTTRTRMESSIVRPPFGNIDPRVQDALKEIGFSSVRWNSDRYDWKLMPEEASVVEARVRQHVEFIKSATSSSVFNRSIIDVNHDHVTATLSSLERIIPVLKDAGFQFVTVNECLQR